MPNNFATKNSGSSITGQARNDRFGRITCFSDRWPSHLSLRGRIVIFSFVAKSPCHSPRTQLLRRTKTPCQRPFCVHDNSLKNGSCTFNNRWLDSAHSASLHPRKCLGGRLPPVASQNGRRRSGRHSFIPNGIRHRRRSSTSCIYLSGSSFSTRSGA